MTNTQHAQLMHELRAIRAVLERSADLAERLVPPEPVDLGAPALEARLAAAPGAQRKRDARKGGNGGGK